MESSLEQDSAPPPPQHYTDMLNLLEESMEAESSSKPHPQPFSQRRSMFSAGDKVSLGERVCLEGRGEGDVCV